MQPSNRTNNINFVLPAGLTLSGVTTWTIGMCHRLIKVGQPVGLIQHAGVRPLLDLPVPAGVQVVECQNRSRPQDFYTEADLFDYLEDYEQLRPGLFLLNGEAGTYATCALMSGSRPEHLRVIGIAHADEPAYYDWLEYYEPMIHKFITVSNEIAANLQQLIPHRETDIVVKPCAVQVNPTLNRSYSNHSQPLQLMYAGRIIEEQKRVSDLLHLAKTLETARVDFQLRLVGDGPDTEKLRSRFAALGHKISQRVTLAGRLSPDQMADAWRKADVCILVSEYEGTSVSMLEAMAAGCVPVVTSVSGTANVIRPGRNGFLVPVGHMAEMARHLKTLDQDRRRLAELGTAAHRTIVERFGYDQYLHWFLEVADQAWQQSPRIWPADRPLHRRPPLKETVEGLSGEQLSQLISAKKLVKALGFKLTALPAFKWLYRFRGPAKKLMGG